MFWSRSYRNRLANSRRRFGAKMHDNAARAVTGRGGLAADAEAKAQDLSSAAMGQLFARVDELADAFSLVSRDATALARTQADTVMDDLIDELKIHPLRSLAIAVGVGLTAGLYLRK